MSSRIEERVRLALDEGVDAYDAALLSRLNRARQRALDEGLDRPARRQPAPWLGWTAAASMALAVVMLAPWKGGEGPASLLPADAAAGTAEDFDFLMAAEEIEVIEDLEFYAWLQQQSLDG